MSRYYSVLKSDYDEMAKSIMELAAVTMKLRAELDAEKAMNARLMKMNFTPAPDPANYLPSECAPRQGADHASQHK